VKLGQNNILFFARDFLQELRVFFYNALNIEEMRKTGKTPGFLRGTRPQHLTWCLNNLLGMQQNWTRV